MIILGIDPGGSGAISVLSGADAQSLKPKPEYPTCLKLDSTEKDIADFLRLFTEKGYEGTVFAYLESVHSMPGQGVSSSFKFGTSYGFIRGCLAALAIPFETVTPQKWQKALGCARPSGTPKESQTEHKNRTKSKAQQLFPHILITHATADSWLIAEYGRRLRAGQLFDK